MGTSFIVSGIKNRYIKYMDAFLKKLGFNTFFESHAKDSGIEFPAVARVIAEHRGAYFVKNIDGEFQAKLTGKQLFANTSKEDYPAVGDWVGISVIDNNQALINQILPRKTLIKKTVASRKSADKMKSQVIAANVDVAFIVESVDRDYSLNRFERYFSLVRDGEVEPSIILNKVDLISRDELSNKIDELSTRFPECKIIATSTATKEGLDDLKGFLQEGKTYCFLGSSGVGKSSLINTLIGEKVLKTGEIGEGTGRGKHVTTHREMFFLGSRGVVIDNPGMREVGLTNSGAGVEATFGEIGDLAKQCQFADCSHGNEPGCAVVKAKESGKLDAERYSNYIQLKKEADHYGMTDYQKRDKDKKFGKFKKNALKRMQDFE